MSLILCHFSRNCRVKPMNSFIQLHIGRNQHPTGEISLFFSQTHSNHNVNIGHIWRHLAVIQLHSNSPLRVLGAWQLVLCSVKRDLVDEGFELKFETYVKCLTLFSRHQVVSQNIYSSELSDLTKVLEKRFTFLVMSLNAVE